MSPDKDLIYIRHILECIGQIKVYSKNGKEETSASTMVQDPTLRRLQTMAESTQRLSDEAKSRISGIDWRSISGFRNILVHDYLDAIDLEAVWKIVKDYIPSLEKAIQDSIQ